MRFAVNDTSYNTQLIMEDIGMEREKMPQRQTLRLSEKADKEIEIVRGAENE
jgi:hypothetical protein